MKLKKNPSKDINKRSGVYFAIGLVTVMLLSYEALEWKTYDKPNTYAYELSKPDDIIEEEYIEKFTVEKPKIKQVLPLEIEIVTDDPEVIEAEIQSTEADPDTKIREVSDIEVIEHELEPEVNWVNIEEVPVFPGCENKTDKRACFGKMIQKHISNVFRYPEQEQELGIQGRVNVMFDIKKDGTICNIRMRGPNDNLENEAARIIGKLPKMTPGKQRDQNVKVSFAIPITFKLQ
ncbi:energy transducer TonB [Maribacter antarcticus]|uniref:energy transducer TonB n=1 Tax=Maribacter antarcticus TaxID=505250 RepID=UPI00047D7234|nr:energy transducer TonB [Maribacter antarcticus]